MKLLLGIALVSVSLNSALANSCKKECKAQYNDCKQQLSTIQSQMNTVLRQVRNQPGASMVKEMIRDQISALKGQCKDIKDMCKEDC